MNAEKPLVLHLKYEYYNMIKSGEKTVEYREFKSYWQKRIKGKTHLVFKSGYNSYYSPDIHAEINKIDVIHYYELPEYAMGLFHDSEYDFFFAIDFKVMNEHQPFC